MNKMAVIVMVCLFMSTSTQAMDEKSVLEALVARLVPQNPRFWDDLRKAKKASKNQSSSLAQKVKVLPTHPPSAMWEALGKIQKQK